MNGPLKGIRVLDLSLLLPGPLCSQHLADMGAEVIKVENPRLGDGTRYMSAKVEKNGNAMSGMFLMLNRNKKSITVNINRDGGKNVIRKLLETTDILLEGFRPGKMEELELGYETLKQKFPRLIYCAISGYGATGPKKHHAGHDANYISLSGLMDSNGEANGKPVIPGFQVADIGGGTLVAVGAICAALYSREKTGEGQFLDISMQDGAFNFLHLYAGEFVASKTDPVRGKMPLSGGLPNYSVYETADGKFVVLAALEEMFFKTFLRQIDKVELLNKYEFNDKGLQALKEELMAIFKSKTFREWAPLFDHPDCCLSPVLSLSEAFSDNQLRERGAVMSMHHPALGEIHMIGSPYRFSKTPVSYRTLPPEHGEHTQEILANLGFSADEIAELQKNRCV